MKTYIDTGDLRSLYAVMRQLSLMCNHMPVQDAIWRAQHSAHLITWNARLGMRDRE